MYYVIPDIKRAAPRRSTTSGKGRVYPLGLENRFQVFVLQPSMSIFSQAEKVGSSLHLAVLIPAIPQLGSRQTCTATALKMGTETTFSPLHIMVGFPINCRQQLTDPQCDPGPGTPGGIVYIRDDDSPHY